MLIFLPSDAFANTRAEQERLLRITMAQPTNYDAAFEYVRVSVVLEDYEAAIGTLERLLLYNPSLTRVKYELGALYFRLRSYELAINYFQQALASPDLDSITRGRIEAALPAAQKQRQQHRVSAFIHAGLRYQTNANFAPSTGLIRFSGVDLGVLPSGRRRAEWNAFALAGLSYDFDLQNQRGDLIETRVLGYATEQFESEDLSVGFLEASIGPRLALAPTLFPGATIKPYVVAGTAAVDEDRFSSAGVGVTLGLPILTNWSVDPFAEWRRSEAAQSTAAAFTTLGSGESITVGWSSAYRLFDGFTLQSRSSYRNTDADNPWQSSTQMSSEVGLAIEFNPPFEALPRRWTLTPYVRYVSTDFDAPNPTVDPTIRRKDKEWRTGVVFDAPITPILGISAAVHYSRVDSNLPNYSNDNVSFMIGPTAQF